MRAIPVSRAAAFDASLSERGAQQEMVHIDIYRHMGINSDVVVRHNMGSTSQSHAA